MKLLTQLRGEPLSKGPARKGNRKLSNRSAAFVRLRKRSLKLSHAANPIPLDSRIPFFHQKRLSPSNVQIRNIARGSRRKRFKFTTSPREKDLGTFPSSEFSGWTSTKGVKIDPNRIYQDLNSASRFLFFLETSSKEENSTRLKIRDRRFSQKLIERGFIQILLIGYQIQNSQPLFSFGPNRTSNIHSKETSRIEDSILFSLVHQFSSEIHSKGTGKFDKVHNFSPLFSSSWKRSKRRANVPNQNLNSLPCPRALNRMEKFTIHDFSSKRKIHPKRISKNRLRLVPDEERERKIRD